MDLCVLCHSVIFGLAMAELSAACPKGQQLLRMSPLPSYDLRARDELHLPSWLSAALSQKQIHPGSSLVSLTPGLCLSLQPVCAGYDLFVERPKLAEWRRRVEEAVGKQLFQEAHEEIMNIKNLTADQFAPEMMENFKQQLLKQVSQN